MSRSATIAAPAAVIREHIRDLHKWEAWSPWQELDPQMNQSYSGEAAGVGAIMEWEGNKKAGAGRIVLAWLLCLPAPWAKHTTFTSVAPLMWGRRL